MAGVIGRATQAGAGDGNTGPAAAEAAARDRRARRMLLAIAAVVAAPLLLAVFFYYFAPPGERSNYGELLPTVPAPAVQGTRADGTPFDLARERGHWTVLLSAPGACDAGCVQALYATRQARTMQGRDRERVQRVWLAGDGRAPDARLLAEHPDLIVVATTPSALAALPRGRDPIYLVDPAGNQVLAWPRNPDIKALARDLARVLKASRIG